MAERIVSPGVFTNEKDLSFLPQGISDIGAALIGPTQDGPAFVPTVIRNLSEFEEIFGKEDQDFYVPFTAKQYLRSAGTVTIVRVLHIGGYQNQEVVISAASSSVTGSVNDRTVLAVLKPSKGADNVDTFPLSSSNGQYNGNGTFNSFSLRLPTDSSGTYKNYTLSFNTGSANYIGKVFSENPQDTSEAIYLAANFEFTQTNGFNHSSASLHVTASKEVAIQSDFTHDYAVATTPSITSQLISGDRTNLFKVNTRSHGTNQNSKYKIGITDVKTPANVPGSDYGSFGLQVMINNPGETDDGTVLESFQNLNLDEDSQNYLPRVIGDRYVTIDSNGKLTYNGDYPNKSKYIYISDYSNLEGISEDLVPMGFGKLLLPFEDKSDASGSVSFPSAQFKALDGSANLSGQQNSRGTFDRNVYYGFDFANNDNKQYLAPTPANATTGSNITMSLENSFGNDDASELGATYASSSQLITLTNSAFQQRKFVVPFQGGFDGVNPAKARNTGTDITAANTQGFDITNSTSSGSVVYKRAINAISNPDEFDINLLSTPGIVHSLHSQVTNHAIDKIESRADAFYIMDGSPYGATIQQAIDNVSSLDTNYVGTYYPWVKVLDSVKNKPTWVPPSVVLPGVYANNDRIGQEWFAPAGLNRGGLTEVLEAETRLTNAERDDLYENRINPIASFPGQGVVVFGQKTLQGKPSALDRINVRRLLINLRKFIASTSNFLVFEQNTDALRGRFLNIVNPYLEQVQANSGLTAFRVVMDESNNTPDVIDRNQLVGQIFIQPTRTAEFIVLDFVVQPTGAAFPE
jgi:phage tail sheath protein FI